MTKRKDNRKRRDYDEYDDDEEDGYYTDYETPPEAIILNGPIYAQGQRGKFGQSWWGKQWVTAMEAQDPDQRLGRGRSYARNGNVLRLEISHGMAFAKVQGSRPWPYLTWVYLKPFTDDQWHWALKALAGQAIYAAKLLAGEMPADIEAVFNSVGLSLFPRDRRDISFECMCPDWGDPCKHAAAVYYLLAERLDDDPFILFHLRGRTREQALAALRALNPNAAAATASALDVANFWSAGELPRIAPPAPTHPLYAQYGNPPGGIAVELRALYDQVAKQAREMLDE